MHLPAAVVLGDRPLNVGRPHGGEEADIHRRIGQIRQKWPPSEMAQIASSMVFTIRQAAAWFGGEQRGSGMGRRPRPDWSTRSAQPRDAGRSRSGASAFGRVTVGACGVSCSTAPFHG